MPREEKLNLPAEWLAAFERDRLGNTISNDPLPERRASRLLAVFIVSGLFFLAFPGTLIGVLNLLSIAGRHSVSAASVAWIQAHGQAQVFGWVGTFILGISLYFLPKFLGRTLVTTRWAWAAWGLWISGAAWRWWIGVRSGEWRVGLVASAALELVAYFVLQYLLWFAGKRPRATSSAASSATSAPRVFVFWLVLAGFASLGVALVVNLAISIQVARTAALPVFPWVEDHKLLFTALWGFAVPAAWGYSSRFVSVFLGLREPARRLAPWLAAGVAVMVVLALAGQFFAADVLALALSIAAAGALRIFERSPRSVKRVGVYAHYDAFVRLSFAWLIVAALLGALSDVLPRVTGLGGASRHALTVGFLATLIFSIGPRILPSFLNGRELWSRSFMAATLWLITLGCSLRVASESLAYSSNGLAWSVLPVSAFIELFAVLLFAANLGMTLAQRIPAWFSPEGVAANNLVYFYIASFPKSRSVLIAAGLKTLAAAGDVPHSLTLQQAAAADHADVEKLLAALRDFFAHRQPRRVGRV